MLCDVFSFSIICSNIILVTWRILVSIEPWTTKDHNWKVITSRTFQILSSARLNFSGSYEYPIKYGYALPISVFQWTVQKYGLNLRMHDTTLLNRSSIVIGFIRKQPEEPDDRKPGICSSLYLSDTVRKQTLTWSSFFLILA